MNKMDAFPEEMTRSVDVPLSLNMPQRLNLVHELRELDTELTESPLVTPYRADFELSGIDLQPRQKGTPTSRMSLKVSRHSDEGESALINLTDRTSDVSQQYTYRFRPSLNIWEEWQPGATEPRRVLDNPTLVDTLEPRLPHGTLETMMDTNPLGFEVVDLLARHLRKKARSRSDLTHYRTHDVIIGDLDFTRDADFLVQHKNNQTTRRLLVSAAFSLADYGPIRKTYDYEMIDRSGSLESAVGTLHLASTDLTDSVRLKAFAYRDAERNDASSSLQYGITDIRRAYTNNL